VDTNSKFVYSKLAFFYQEHCYCDTCVNYRPVDIIGDIYMLHTSYSKIIALVKFSFRVFFLAKRAKNADLWNFLIRLIPNSVRE
jgi:hypothetical protein